MVDFHVGRLVAKVTPLWRGDTPKAPRVAPRGFPYHGQLRKKICIPPDFFGGENLGKHWGGSHERDISIILYYFILNMKVGQIGDEF